MLVIHFETINRKNLNAQLDAEIFLFILWSIQSRTTKLPEPKLTYHPTLPTKNPAY